MTAAVTALIALISGALGFVGGTIPYRLWISPWFDARDANLKRLREEHYASIGKTFCAHPLKCRREGSAPLPVPVWYVDSNGTCEQCQLGGRVLDFPYSPPNVGETRVEWNRRMKRGGKRWAETRARAWNPSFLRRLYRRLTGHTSAVDVAALAAEVAPVPVAARARIATPPPQASEAPASEAAQEGEAEAEEEAAPKLPPKRDAP